MKESENKTMMIGFEPMQSFIETLYDSILDVLNDINISTFEFINSLEKTKYSQTKGE